MPKRKVVKLHLLGVVLSPPNVARLAAAIAGSAALKTVHLFDAELEDAGIAILAQALLDNGRVEELILARNHVGGRPPGPAAARALRAT